MARITRYSRLPFGRDPGGPGMSCLEWVEPNAESELSRERPLKLISAPSRGMRLARRLFGRRVAIRLAART